MDAVGCLTVRYRHIIVTYDGVVDTVVELVSHSFEDKTENKQVVINGFQRTLAVTQIRPSTQSPDGSQTPKDTR